MCWPGPAGSFVRGDSSGVCACGIGGAEVACVFAIAPCHHTLSGPSIPVRGQRPGQRARDRHAGTEGGGGSLTWQRTRNDGMVGPWEGSGIDERHPGTGKRARQSEWASQPWVCIRKVDDEEGEDRRGLGRRRGVGAVFAVEVVFCGIQEQEEIHLLPHFPARLCLVQDLGAGRC